MWFKWLPWKTIISYAARKQGFLDPFSVLSNVSGFAKPSEVFVPVELLRSGFVLHARGLVNSQAIQHNLDWVWPYWVVKQFNPKDNSFIPRAFSLTHINLTHRNWTAIGLPGCDIIPIVDPRGLVTPFYDGWSIDAWIISDKKVLVPSLSATSQQSADIEKNIKITTKSAKELFNIKSTASVVKSSGRPICQINIEAYSKPPAWLAISVRPYNPEGISFIKKISVLDNKMGWRVDSKKEIWFNARPDHYKFSNYSNGDVYQNILSRKESQKISCGVGMCTGAALFRIFPGRTRKIAAHVPLEKKKSSKEKTKTVKRQRAAALKHASRLNVPDKKVEFLYNAALRTLLLHSQKETYAGPYTYKRFWFRDAVFISYAFLCAGLFDKAESVIDSFLAKQRPNGYFCSQNGEWDSNGQVLWVMNKFCEIAGRKCKRKWVKAIEQGARWIQKKITKTPSGAPHSGLLPAGFSAEHLGPSDYYFWDDFWAVAGLKAASYIMGISGSRKRALDYYHKSLKLMKSLEKSLKLSEKRLGTAAMPASPYRRLDSGAVGSLSAGYPLQLFNGDDRRLAATADYLLDNCFVDGGFFHDMSHSGINPYLTLHIAQVLLRKGDKNFFNLMEAVKNLASPTGQWPEAVHPGTGGGCMGDGQHVWAAAEWIIMVRNCFVRQEGESLVLCSGVSESWRRKGTASYGPAPTRFGPVSVFVKGNGKKTVVSWQANWYGVAPDIEIRLPGCKVVRAKKTQRRCEFKEVI